MDQSEEMPNSITQSNNLPPLSACKSRRGFFKRLRKLLGNKTNLDLSKNQTQSTDQESVEPAAAIEDPEYLPSQLTKIENGSHINLPTDLQHVDDREHQPNRLQRPPSLQQQTMNRHNRRNHSLRPQPIQTNEQSNTSEPESTEYEIESDLRKEEIEQLKNEEHELSSELEELIRQMNNLESSLVQLEQKEAEQLDEKQQEALQFEKEFRSRMEALQVRRDEAEREMQLWVDRLNELRRRTNECNGQKKMAKQMMNEVKRCLSRLSDQYDSGCAKYRADLELLNTRQEERRKRDQQLMENYAKRREELCKLLKQRNLVRKSLEEHEKLRSVLGSRGIRMLVQPNSKKLT